MSNQNAPSFNTHHFEAIKKGIELFNSQHYWECHEELEHHWLEDTADPVRYVYWAVIQVAAAMIHVRDQNISGARGLLLKARDKLTKCESLHVESAYLRSVLNWDEFKKLVNDVSDLDDLQSYQQLFQFRFKLKEI